MAGECHLGVGCVEGRGDRDLVLCSRRDVEGSLPHYWHVEMMHDRHLQHCAVTVISSHLLSTDFKFCLELSKAGLQSGNFL